MYTHAPGFFSEGAKITESKNKINMCVHFIKKESVSWVSMSITLFCLALEAELQFTLFQNIFISFNMPSKNLIYITLYFLDSGKKHSEIE